LAYDSIWEFNTEQSGPGFRRARNKVLNATWPYVLGRRPARFRPEPKRGRLFPIPSSPL